MEERRIYRSHDSFCTNHLFVTGGYLLWGFFFFSHNKEFRARDVLLETFSGKMSPKSPPLRQFPGKDTSMKCW